LSYYTICPTPPGEHPRLIYTLSSSLSLSFSPHYDLTPTVLTDANPHAHRRLCDVDQYSPTMLYNRWAQARPTNMRCCRFSRQPSAVTRTARAWYRRGPCRRV